MQERKWDWSLSVADTKAREHRSMLLFLSGVTPAKGSSIVTLLAPLKLLRVCALSPSETVNLFRAYGVLLVRLVLFPSS